MRDYWKLTKNRARKIRCLRTVAGKMFAICRDGDGFPALPRAHDLADDQAPLVQHAHGLQRRQELFVRPARGGTMYVEEVSLHLGRSVLGGVYAALWNEGVTLQQI